LGNYRPVHWCPFGGLSAIPTAPETITKSHITDRHTEGRKACEYKSQDNRKRHILDDGGIEKG
jgi:hypothetical protein